MRKLNAKQAAFVREYNKDSNATQAALRAGYAKASAHSQAHDLLKKPEIREAIMKGVKKEENLATVDKAWVLSMLRKNLELAMALRPVKDKEGNTLGMLTYQGAVANKAIELLGKNLGMFKDKLDVKIDGAEEIKSGFSLVHDAYAAQQKRNAAEAN